MSILHLERFCKKSRKRKTKKSILADRLDDCFAYNNAAYQKNIIKEFERRKKEAEKRQIYIREKYWENPEIQNLFASKQSFSRWYCFHTREITSHSSLISIREKQLRRRCKKHVC